MYRKSIGLAQNVPLTPSFKALCARYQQATDGRGVNQGRRPDSETTELEVAFSCPKGARRGGRSA